MEDKKVYSLEEVSAHNHSRDCWLVIGGKIYDVSKFLEDHPGGDEVLLSATDVVSATSPRQMYPQATSILQEFCRRLDNTRKRWLHSAQDNTLIHGVIRNVEKTIYSESLKWKLNTYLWSFKSDGKDATDDFEDVGHSTSARAMMDEYYVGEIDPSTIPSKPTFLPAKQAAYNPDKSSEFLIKILQFLVPLAILALAVAVRFFTKNEDVKNK